MTIVIDINVLPAVFNSSDNRHNEFKPVKEWIMKRLGFMVYGGTKYKDELRKMPRYIGVINELKKQATL